MSRVLTRYCSWCHEKTQHRLVQQGNVFTRNVYRCRSCENYTLECRFCKNMARGKPRDSARSRDDGFLASLRRDWNDELCAEHDGTVASFRKLSARLADLADYKDMFAPEKMNLYRVAKTAGAILAGAAVFCPLTYMAAPAVASALGAAGILGAASTGTAISALHGAALTSASLAAIGGGTMAGGMVVMTAAGAALGAVHGGVISNAYFRDVKDFRIEKVNEGSGPPLVFINGFLSEKDQDCSDWANAVRARFAGHPWYYVRWESGALSSLGHLATSVGSASKLSAWAGKAASRASRRAASMLRPLTWSTWLARLLRNPWHTAIAKASQTGVLLADLLSRVEDTDFILMGNSLGCRVVYYALSALSTRSTRQGRCIKDVYLLGGAMDGGDRKGWRAAAKAIKGKIYNCYSGKDRVLRYLYRPANAWLSRPIGLGPIAYAAKKIANWDVSDIVAGHMEYKASFAEILDRIHGR